MDEFGNLIFYFKRSFKNPSLNRAKNNLKAAQQAT